MFLSELDGAMHALLFAESLIILLGCNDLFWTLSDYRMSIKYDARSNFYVFSNCDYLFWTLFGYRLSRA